MAWLPVLRLGQSGVDSAEIGAWRRWCVRRRRRRRRRARMARARAAPTPPWHVRVDGESLGLGLCLFKLYRDKLTSTCSTGLDVRFWARGSWLGHRSAGVGWAEPIRPKSAHGGGGACAAVAVVDGAHDSRASRAGDARRRIMKISFNIIVRDFTSKTACARCHLNLL